MIVVKESKIVKEKSARFQHITWPASTMSTRLNNVFINVQCFHINNNKKIQLTYIYCLFNIYSIQHQVENNIVCIMQYIHTYKKTFIVYSVRQILDFWPSSLFFAEDSLSLGRSVNVLLTAAPVLHLLLIVLCPKIIAFWVACVSRYVGFSFWPFAALSWQKWFSTTSWFRMAGLIVDPGNRFSFILTNEIIPSIIACKSNHSFEDTNSSFFEIQAFHFDK